jgi:quercetin dioxygenase-like cupin family protein
MRAFASGEVRRLLVVFAGTSAILSVITGHAQDAKAVAQKIGVSSSELFLAAVPGAGNTEVTVLEVTYLPGAMNPRHFHPAAVTFHVIAGTPVFQEDGKEPVTLKPGDSLLIPAGTTHSHWNPSKTEGVRWLEFIVAEKGKGRAIRKP